VPPTNQDRIAPAGETDAARLTSGDSAGPSGHFTDASLISILALMGLRLTHKRLRMKAELGCGI